MGLLKNSLSAIGRLLTVVALAGTFLVGLFGVVYLQLSGEEITIPKVVGKNFNDGKVELTQNGLKIKKIATRYSNEEPNTILEQRPRAGTTAKTGLMISVIVSEPNPDGNETPVDIKGDDEAIEEIESLPELKTDKSKKKASNKNKKVESKTRDVVKTDVNKTDEKTTTDSVEKSKSTEANLPKNEKDNKQTEPNTEKKPPVAKPKDEKKKVPVTDPVKPKPKTNGN